MSSVRSLFVPIKQDNRKWFISVYFKTLPSSEGKTDKVVKLVHAANVTTTSITFGLIKVSTLPSLWNDAVLVKR